MTYRMPSARRGRKRVMGKLNLIPILDAIFIFIFFLLSSASFIQIFEISSTKPIVSSTPPPPKRPPLALTLEINTQAVVVKTGVPSRVKQRFGKNSEGEYDLEGLHQFVFSLKERNLNEKSAVLIPQIDLPYEILIQIIDAIRSVNNTDPPLYKKDKDGIDVKVDLLFSEITFGNLLS